MEWPSLLLHLWDVIVFLIIIGFILGVLLWLLFAPVVLEADTRVPYVLLRWTGIGQATILYDEEWKLKWRLFFFGKTVDLKDIARTKKKKAIDKPRKVVKKKKKTAPGKMLMKMIRVIKTFRVHSWQWALDTGDNTLNAQLYPVNFLPGCRGHMLVNFTGENYLQFRISNRPWRVLWAWMKK